MLNNKKAQIAETMTWLVATIIILVILAIAIYAASFMSVVTRTINVEADESAVLLKKSLHGYLLTRENPNEENVFSKLEGSGSLEGLNKKLMDEVFKDPSGEFIFTLRLNSWEFWQNYHKKIKINEKTILGVFKDDAENTDEKSTGSIASTRQ